MDENFLQSPKKEVFPMSEIKFDTEIFRKRMKQARLLAGLTLDEVAQRIGVSRPTVSKYESGAISSVDYSRVEEIAGAIGVTPEYLLGQTDSPELPKEEQAFYDFLYNIPPVSVSVADVLGQSFLLLATNPTVQLILKELLGLTPEQRDLALKMIKAISE